MLGSTGRAALLAAALAAPLVATLPLHAQETASAGNPSGNPYVQTGVPAEATAENGVLAREQALAAGRRTAWARLAAELGIASPPAVSDSQLQSMVSSIVIEQERVTPTRYAGRITVNFNPGRARGVLGSRAPSGSGEASAGGAVPQAPSGPASTWVEAVAVYGSLEEWLELQRRLKGAPAVASLQVQALAVDRARLRLGLRMPGPAAATELAGRGIAAAPAETASGPVWRVGLAQGG